MKAWRLTNKNAEVITVLAENFSDLPVAFCFGGDEPSDVIKAEMISK